MSKSYANNLITANLVVDNLNDNNCCQIPLNEAQTRPLTKLETPKQQQEAWEKVVETAPEGKITALYVSKVVSEIKKENFIKEVRKNKDRATSINKEELIDEEVQRTFDAFYREIQRAQMEKWNTTTREAALSLIELIRDLITI